MKRIITLMLALGLVFGAVANSSAADIKAKGSFTMEYGWMDNLNFEDGSSTDGDGNSEDDFVAQQRFRTQIDIVASENLSGVVFFEIDNAWGRNDATGKTVGGAIGADGINIETKRAFIDWTVPNTDLAFRMGIQGLALPAPVAGSSILDDDVAAILATYKVNDMLTLNAFWARPYDGQQGEPMTAGNHNDEIDLFGLIAGVELDGMTITPWAMYGAVGGGAAGTPGGLKSLFAANAPTGNTFGQNLNATNNWGVLGGDAYLSYNGTENIDNHRAWWLGLGYELNMFDPIVFSFEAVYGKVDGGDLNYRLTSVNGSSGGGTILPGNNTLHSDDDILDREGWALAAKLSYKMDMVTPGLVGWYASGEDDDIRNGSERLPVISGAFSPTTFGFDGYAGGFAVGTGDLLGTSYDGKWGAGLLIEDIKVIEDLTSQFRVVYIEGTNDADVLDEIVKYTGTTKADFLKANVGTFMTDKDNAWEVNFDHKYMIYENLAMIVELGYVNLNLDEDAWGIRNNAAEYDEDAWKTNLIFQYTF